MCTVGAVTCCGMVPWGLELLVRLDVDPASLPR